MPRSQIRYQRTKPRCSMRRPMSWRSRAHQDWRDWRDCAGSATRRLGTGSDLEVFGFGPDRLRRHRAIRLDGLPGLAPDDPDALDRGEDGEDGQDLSLIHISEPTRL